MTSIWNLTFKFLIYYLQLNPYYEKVTRSKFFHLEHYNRRLEVVIKEMNMKVWNWKQPNFVQLNITTKSKTLKTVARCVFVLNTTQHWCDFRVSISVSRPILINISIAIIYYRQYWCNKERKKDPKKKKEKKKSMWDSRVIISH